MELDDIKALLEKLATIGLPLARFKDARRTALQELEYQTFSNCSKPLDGSVMQLFAERLAHTHRLLRELVELTPNAPGLLLDGDAPRIMMALQPYGIDQICTSRWIAGCGNLLVEFDTLGDYCTALLDRDYDVVWTHSLCETLPDVIDAPAKAQLEAAVLVEKAIEASTAAAEAEARETWARVVDTLDAALHGEDGIISLEGLTQLLAQHNRYLVMDNYMDSGRIWHGNAYETKLFYEKVEKGFSAVAILEYMKERELPLP